MLPPPTLLNCNILCAFFSAPRDNCKLCPWFKGPPAVAGICRAGLPAAQRRVLEVLHSSLDIWGLGSSGSLNVRCLVLFFCSILFCSVLTLVWMMRGRFKLARTVDSLEVPGQPARRRIGRMVQSVKRFGFPTLKRPEATGQITGTKAKGCVLFCSNLEPPRRELKLCFSWLDLEHFRTLAA